MLCKALQKLRLILLMLIIPSSIQSCRLIKPSQVKQAEKVEKEQIKESEKAYELLKEEHQNRQSISTYERMQVMKKKSEFLNLPKKRPTFWQRIFRKRDKRK